MDRRRRVHGLLALLTAGYLACSSDPRPDNRVEPSRASAVEEPVRDSERAGASNAVEEPARDSERAGASEGVEAAAPQLENAAAPAADVREDAPAGEVAIVPAAAKLDVPETDVAVPREPSDAATPSIVEPSDVAAPVAEAAMLYAAQREVFVYERPSTSSRRLGYLRAGGRVRRSAEPTKAAGCDGGFYRVAPDGYVCAGMGAKLEASHPVSELLASAPDRLAPLPYVYARVRGALPPYYTKLPSPAEQREVEPEIGGRGRPAPAFAELTSGAPEWLLSGKNTPTLFGYPRGPANAAARRAIADSSFAVLRVFEHAPRHFGLRSDLTLVPLDRVERVKPSDFHGVPLDEAGLPVAFVMHRSGWLYSGDGKSGLTPVRRLGFREGVPLTGTRQKIGAFTFLQTRDGHWLRDDRVVHVAPLPALPRWATNDRPWVHVSIGQQTLVAYRGERPVYVTLVSTGADGLGDPATTRSTVRGQFLVHTKHVTSPMTSDVEGDEYDLPDVPWVQYFSDNYAFHAAYWHDAFGTPRSHGCINLSPRDARYLFHFTDPPVPQGWHGAFSLRQGTLVDITP